MRHEVLCGRRKICLSRKSHWKSNNGEIVWHWNSEGATGGKNDSQEYFSSNIFKPGMWSKSPRALPWTAVVDWERDFQLVSQHCTQSRLSRKLEYHIMRSGRDQKECGHTTEYRHNTAQYQGGGEIFAQTSRKCSKIRDYTGLCGIVCKYTQ